MKMSWSLHELTNCVYSKRNIMVVKQNNVKYYFVPENEFLCIHGAVDQVVPDGRVERRKALTTLH